MKNNPPGCTCREGHHKKNHLETGGFFRFNGDPITILSGLPTAGFGALITQMIFGSGLNIYGFVGISMPLGIANKSVIMMISFAMKAERTEGKRPLDTFRKERSYVLRPIMMTTTT